MSLLGSPSPQESAYTQVHTSSSNVRTQQQPQQQGSRQGHQDTGHAGHKRRRRSSSQEASLPDLATIGSLQSACITTLNTIELLSMILSHLSIRDLFTVQRVCHLWKAATSEDQAIRRLMFLENLDSTDIPRINPLLMYEIPRIVRESENLWLRIRVNDHRHGLECTWLAKFPIRTHQVLVSSPSIYSGSGATSITQSLHGSFEDTFITLPAPIRAVVICGMTIKIIEEANGIRLRDVIEVWDTVKRYSRPQLAWQHHSNDSILINFNFD